MSQTLGPPLSLDGPLPVAPLRSLLNTVTVIDSSDLRFGVGGVVWGYPPGLPEAWDPCSTGTFRTKSSRHDDWDLPQFQPFTVYQPITCSSITAHAPGFADRAVLALAATESYAVARELARGEANPLNPFLDDANLTILNAGVAVNADYALGLLEDAIGATGRGGVILTSPAVGAAFNGGTGGYGIDTKSGALQTTANGTPVALDGGFIGSSPSLHAVLGAGEAWAFATGPIHIRRSPQIEILSTLKESTDRSDNTVTFRAERDYLVTWDTSLQAGVLIDLTGCVLC
jgi:hypothetical protein